LALPQIFIVSDGRGETAQSLLRSALVQFEGPEYESTVFRDVLSAARVREVLEQAAECHATVFYTLVADETRAAMLEGSNQLLVPAVDLVGPALSALFDLLKVRPAFEPGRLYKTDRDHIDRLDAVNYTLKHDDGQHPEGLADAQVVLVGVSRASKSSTAFFLGYHGIRAANVPLIPGLKPSAELTGLDPKIVIGLTINGRRLKTLREARAPYIGGHETERYVDEEAIREEIHYANQLMMRHNWRTVDVSYKAIEEVAKEVAALRGIRLRFPI
jgi:regulator of PEP synthase PpsR (kinase-PPPase family)